MFECEKCGARNFRTLQALGSHRSSGNCRAAARVQVGNNQAGRAASSSQPDFPACDPPEARGNAGQHAAAAADEDAQDSKRQRVEQPEEREAPGNAADLAEQGPAPSAAGSDPSLGRFFLAPEEDPERERFRELRELHQHLLDLSTFVRSVLNGQGLPRPDIQRLLDYVHSAGFDASKLPDTVAQLEKFEDENLYSESEVSMLHFLRCA